MEGTCQCGEIRFTTPLPEPITVYVCHCTECRHQSSSAFGITALFPDFDVTPPGTDAVRVYSRQNSSGWTDGYWCTFCGCRFMHKHRTHDNRLSKNVSVKGGCLTALSRDMMRKAVHIWTRSAVVDIPAGVTSYEQEPDDGSFEPEDHQQPECEPLGESSMRLKANKNELQELSPLKGKLVIETFKFDGGRRVTVYIPPQPAQGFVFAGDGQSVPMWARTLEATNAPPVIMVGTHRLSGEMERLHEYSPVFDPDKFSAHEKFFVKDVRDWVQSRFKVALTTERTAVFGVSAGGELALALGIRHPDIFGSVLCASPGRGYLPPDSIPSLVPRVYLVAGTLEPFFLENADRWAQALSNAGADVMMTEPVGSHGNELWCKELPMMVAWAFGELPTP